MREQRKHQRVRFKVPPVARIGYGRNTGLARLENLSVGGLMLRCEVPLKLGEPFGCEFSILATALLDLSAVVVSRLGDLYGARFRAGPVSELLLEDEIAQALAIGKASVLNFRELAGRRIMVVVGGLNASLQGDFMHALTRTGVDEIDLSGVTDVDQAGAELCRTVTQGRSIAVIRPKPPLDPALAALAGW